VTSRPHSFQDAVQRLAEGLAADQVRQHLADAQQPSESVLEQQVLLAVEVEVERPLRHPGGRADRVDGRVVDAVLEKEPIGRLANGRARMLASLRCGLPGATR